MSKKSSIFAVRNVKSDRKVNVTEEIEKVLGAELNKFREAYAAALRSDNPLLQAIGEHLLSRKGKQLRPMLVLLAARLCHGVNEKTISTAVAFELLHTATLIHDDVVDDSELRRGVPTIKKRWTNKVAVLAGDYLLSKVIAITASLRNQKIFNVVGEIGQTLAKGELLQLHTNGSLQQTDSSRAMWIDEPTYFAVIEQKTASLFAACTQAGAVSSGASMRQETALRTFGLELGLIFQMKDDLLDYSDSEELGKPTMSDIADGKVTLPLLISLQRAPKEDADEIRTLAEKLANGEETPSAEQTILSFVLRYDGVGYVRQQMELHKRKAVEALSVFHDSSLKAALIQLLEYTITRVY